MKIGRTMNELAAELTRQLDSKQDIIADTTQVAVVPGDTGSGPLVEIKNTGSYPIRDLALSQLGERAGIHASYMTKMREDAPELLATNLNHWFQAKPERRLLRA